MLCSLKGSEWISRSLSQVGISTITQVYGRLQHGRLPRIGLWKISLLRLVGISTVKAIIAPGGRGNLHSAITLPGSFALSGAWSHKGMRGVMLTGRLDSAKKHLSTSAIPSQPWRMKYLGNFSSNSAPRWPYLTTSS